MATQIDCNNEESFSYALQIVTSSVLPMSMHAAVQLDISGIMAKCGPDAELSAKEIAAQLATNNSEAASMLDRILVVLANHGIVGCSVADEEKSNPRRLYSLTPVSKFFMWNEDGVSLGPLTALIQDKVFIDSWDCSPMTTQIDCNNEESFSYALQIVSSLVLPMSMHAAVQLDIFGIMAKCGPDVELSAKEIAAQLATNNSEAASMLDRILVVLASHGIVGCSVADEEKGNPHRLYSLTPVSKFFVRNEDGLSLCPLMALVQDKVFIDSWSQLKDAIIGGGVPFDRVHGTNAFEYPGKDPRFNQIFNTAMINHTGLVLKEILHSYKGFQQLSSLVDVGGGLGITLNLITSKYPSIKGINFDLPHVIQEAPAYPGVQHVGGDMFESVPKGDAIFMKWILHDWRDDYCLKLLKNCYNAIPKDGKVIVVEAVVPVLPEANAYLRSITQFDVLMMAQNPGGKERTKSEFEALATKAGFSGIRYECFACNYWIMEFFK